MNPFASSRDVYKVIGVSTAHIEESDAERLASSHHSMIMPRDTGAFVKLYAEDQSEPRDLSEDFPGFSQAFYGVLHCARSAGFGMVELDADAETYDDLPTFSW